MDVYHYFNYLSSAWMIVEAVPLILSPTLIITLLSPDVRESTSLEEYLSRSLGLTLVAFSVLLLILTGSIPLTSSIATTTVAKGTSTGTSTDPENPTAPYALPALTISLTYHCAVAFYCYSMYTTGHALTFTIAVAVHSVFAAIGGWVLMFGASDGRISRKTGADKRVSGFPFKNTEADKRKGKKGL